LDEQDTARSGADLTSRSPLLREQQLRRFSAGASSTSAAATPTPVVERTATQATSVLSRVAVKGSSLKPRKVASEDADASIVGVTRQGDQLVWSVLTCEELNDGAVLFSTEYMLRHHADLLVECAALYAESLQDLQNLPQRGNTRR
jgi:hypothetical protein